MTLLPKADRVAEAQRYLEQVWAGVCDTLFTITHDAAEGSTCWFSLWSPGRFSALSCDFSYMISPHMLRELFLPAIERQTQRLDHAIYHVDGIGSFGHVPALLELPRLQALQILPGAGKPSPLHYLDTLRLVQSGGKNLHITIPPEEVEMALELLSARGLFIRTHCESEQQARSLLKAAEKLSPTSAPRLQTGADPGRRPSQSHAPGNATGQCLGLSVPRAPSRSARCAPIDSPEPARQSARD